MPLSDDQVRQMIVWSQVFIEKLGREEYIEMLKGILEKFIRDNPDSDQIDEARDWIRELQDDG